MSPEQLREWRESLIAKHPSRDHWTDEDMDVMARLAYDHGVWVGNVAKRQQWLPIESAPTDGTEILLIATVGNMLVPKPVRVTGHFSRGWWSLTGKVLSHMVAWQHLPPEVAG